MAGLALVVSTLFALGGSPIAGAAVAPGTPPTSGGARAGKSASALSPRLTALAGANDRSTRGLSAAAQLPSSGPGSLRFDAAGRVLVDVLLDTQTPDRIAGLNAVGATVTAQAPESPRVTVSVDTANLQRLAAAPGVRSVDEVLAPKSSATCPTGVVDEGDTQLSAATARSTFSVTGAGVKVGILSDSFNAQGGAATDVAAAELPGPGNPCAFPTPTSVLADGAAGSTDEGRAMAQIVHDIAPGAALSFSTANGGETAFANAIRAQQAAGAKVIVDDVGYFAEPMYQDGVVAKAVRDVTALGSVYYSAAGNANSQIGGLDVGSYEAPAYRPATCPVAVANITFGGQHEMDCHDFNPGAGTDAGDVLTTAAGGHLQISFGWNEPQFGIASDFDAFLLDNSGTIVAGSAESNVTSTQRAFEFIDVTNNSGVTQNYRLVVARWSGSTPRFKFIIQTDVGLNAVQYNTSSLGDVVGPTIFGHSAVIGMGTTGAIRFNTNTQPEFFSGRGPATYCWGPVVGNTAAASLGACQTKTIDFVATDGGINSFFGSFTGGVWRFFGTSAAAPHAAAIAALQLQAQPCRGPAEVLAAQKASATSVGAFGVNAVGSGMLNAVGAINSLAGCLPASHFSVVASPAVTVGQQVTVTVTALDTNNQKVTNYNGTVHFTSVGGSVVLPADSTLTLGTRSFTATFSAVGSRTITATDTVSAGITGTSNTIVISNPFGYHALPTPVRILETRASLGALQYSTPWGQGVDRNVHVVSNGVPAGAKAVVLNVTAVNPSLPTDLRIYPSGQARPNVSNLNPAAGQTIANSVFATIGTGGDIQIYNNSGTVDVLADLVGWVDDGTNLGGAGLGDRYKPVNPARILETRASVGALQYSTPWGPAQTRTVHVWGNGGVPSGATAVALNVTVVNPSLESHLRVFPAGQGLPNTSSINFVAGQVIPNLVVATIGTGGDIQIYNNSGTVDVLADVVGYFQAPGLGGDGYHTMSPSRILETRPSVGALQYSTPWGQGVDRTVHVTGGAVPSYATAVVVNVTVTNPTLPSDLRIFPSGQAQPNTSSLNFTTNQTVANLVIARVGSGGNIEIYNNSGSVDVIMDVVGYYT